MKKKKPYYYRVQISWPSTKIMYFKSYSKREIKEWTKAHHCGPNDVFIDDPYIKPDENIRYEDLTNSPVS